MADQSQEGASSDFDRFFCKSACQARAGRAIHLSRMGVSDDGGEISGGLDRGFGRQLFNFEF